MATGRRSITLEQKSKIIDELVDGTSNADVCRKYGLSTSTVSTIWKHRDKIKDSLNSNISKLKRIRKPVNKEVDQALLEWFKQKRTQNIPISGPILQEKAEEFSRLLSTNNETSVCSKSWIDRFKKRYHISSSKIHGEAASVSAETTRDWLNNIWPDLRRDYSNNDIFNGDETGLFYKLVPNQTLKFQKEKCHGGKKSKDRITVLVCANMTGTEKRKLLVIGKSKTPRCFKNCNTLPVNYVANKKAWVTSEVFEKEIRSWDFDLQKQKRKIILLVDNCPAHPIIENLRNIKLIFLPPNTTAALQPMDQGIIACLKQHYKKIFLCKMISFLDNGEEFKFSLLDAVLAINTAWKRVTQKTIVNCYRHAGFYRNPEFDDEDEIPLPQLLLQNHNTENVDDEDCLCLRDWAVKNNIVHGSFTNDTLNAFETVDDCLVTCEYPSEGDIAAAIISQNTQDYGQDISEDDEEEDTSEPPTTQQVFGAMKTISTYLEINDFESSIKDKFDCIQRSLEKSLIKKSTTQKKITDYLCISHK